ncbi:DUF4398 domain-containing protein [Pseudomonas sp. WS 5412]|uniref:DUF4398 domain-containing protein n=1 Tax=Pseudomonas sp. WS 5412 TaxID=2717487 RepID=UPI0014731A24|nr:DUF4398 domain-containing protein [Pseudomonas sp. WS 5412]NMY30692.1 DUF4398 domain-containing protein [Pseudomonas sp. WS 5412]
MTNELVFVRTRKVALLVAMTGALAACASVPEPNDQIALSQNAVARAISADATQYAPVEMNAAQDKMFLMERAMGERDYIQARTLAEQIEVDANLAERKAQTAKWQHQLQQSQAGIQVLKQEMLQAPVTGFMPAADAAE